ncbi:FAD-binding oxidoreductase [Colwellia hornerae]|uniref:FAD-binding oxidoreductase n=1 Tax=Colwellia hornerae TaxID=89402 RepID=A0A5C6QI89_9GAMM|nr:FAD-binding protein [Colwellia hornerae]TWX52478.1 FAD-binding oxidoreductase [Colwellia hornerae]TWX58307.1 FAD-binding oxidoreductase [Colwellia hornerae]TWX68348.1 FAD-binding oxidoreductase [Colwellia hornerae]
MDTLFEKLKNILSPNAIILSTPEQTAPYLRGTEGINRDITAVVKVALIEDIPAILKLANSSAIENQNQFSVHPICSGRNWGYGTGLPPTDILPVVIIDLSMLKRICLIPELDLVTIEPGVTQQDLYDYLQKNNANYMVPTTGAGPDCAILSNAIERGYGITPNTQHFDAVTSLKGYWASGELFQSAISDLDKSTNPDGTSRDLVDKTFKYSPGPYIDGLFTQSSLGIVTEITIRLAQKRAAFKSFFIKVYNDDLLTDIVPLIQTALRNYEGIVGSINLMDKRRILSMFAENPNGTDQHQVMSLKQIDNIAKQQDTPCWTIVGTIYGTTAVVNVVAKEIKNLFKQIKCKFIFSDSSIIKLGNLAVNNTPRFLFNLSPKLVGVKKQLDSFNLGEEIMLGKPNRVALKLAYWRNPNLPSFNNEPDHVFSIAKDKCGLLWYAPLIPMIPSEMKRYVNFIRKTCPKYNIEPFITFTNLRHDCIDSTIPIVFDSSNPTAVKDAQDCLKELVLEGMNQGWVPYRLNIDQQQWLLDKDKSFWKAVQLLKNSFDPNNILSPGRYNPK